MSLSRRVALWEGSARRVVALDREVIWAYRVLIVETNREKVR